MFSENLYTSSGFPVLKYHPGGATRSWQSEVRNYNFATGKPINPSKPIGHFTAQVWKKVSSVGFGFCATTNGKYTVLYVVANYGPTPNVVGQYTQNVFKA